MPGNKIRTMAAHQVLNNVAPQLQNRFSDAGKDLPEPLARPRRRDVFFHGFKTLKVIGSLLKDRRVPVYRKALFFLGLAGFAFILLFPDVLGEFVMSTLLPIVGTVLGIPIDAGFDWVAFALVGILLLRVFPAEIVSEHYKHHFQRHRHIRNSYSA